MANSKSTIYPVQLQGAELNLNKLDAEIKQYSGFNKNNSPFVGGCLSNIFKKESSISGGNDKNVYVAPNGDVYNLTANGLFKNGNNVMLMGGSNFYSMKKINSKIDDGFVVRCFSEHIRIVKKYDDTMVYYQVYYDNEQMGNQNLIGYGTYLSDFTELEKKFVWNALTGIFVTKGDKLFFIVGYAVHGGSNIYVYDCETKERVGWCGLTTWISDDLDIPVALCYDETSSQVSLFYSQDEEYQFALFASLADDGSLTKIYPQEAPQAITEIDASIETTAEKLSPKDLGCYHILNYPYNMAILKKQPYQTVTSSEKFKIIGRLKNPYYDNGLKFRTKTVMDYDKVYSVNDGFLETNTGFTYNFFNGTYLPLMACFDYQALVSVNSGEVGTNQKCICIHHTSDDYCFNGFSFFDYTPSVVVDKTLSKAKFVLGDRVTLGKKFCLMFNNNQLSGIAGKNVLFTNWNAIDAKTIAFYADNRNNAGIEEVIYKDGDDWFLISAQGTPEIRVFGNQLVINNDNVFNSFDMKREKTLHFATNYNSFMDTVDRQSRTTFYNCYGVSDNVYAAGAVNEYKHEDNSSIILNPISFYTDKSVTNWYRFITHFLDYVDIYYNLYSGDTNFKYAYTTYCTINYGNYYTVNVIDKDLSGLLYPSDTNGNVEYNVNLFSELMSIYGNMVFIKSSNNSYPLVIGNNNEVLMSYYLASGVENLENAFIIQGQYYGIIQDQIFSLQFNNGVVANITFVVNIEGLQFVGNTPYEALFFSKTNRCLYSFTGANVLNQKQLIDKISEVRNYLYNPATQTVFLITDIGVLFYGLFGVYLLEFTDISKIFLLENGIVMSDNIGNYRYIKYYLDEGDTDYVKENINIETCFYGMNNEMMTINDCLYFRLFSEEHEEGDLKVSATTISLSGRKTEETTFKIKATDWDKITHTIYLRYQPKAQRGLGVSFSINSPFKIASLSVGSQPDAVLVDKVSKGAITAPQQTSNNIEW